jgi:hypothetical protein
LLHELNRQTRLADTAAANNREFVLAKSRHDNVFKKRKTFDEKEKRTEKSNLSFSLSLRTASLLLREMSGAALKKAERMKAKTERVRTHV